MLMHVECVRSLSCVTLACVLNCIRLWRTTTKIHLTLYTPRNVLALFQLVDIESIKAISHEHILYSSDRSIRAFSSDFQPTFTNMAFKVRLRVAVCACVCLSVCVCLTTWIKRKLLSSVHNTNQQPHISDEHVPLRAPKISLIVWWFIGPQIERIGGAHERLNAHEASGANKHISSGQNTICKFCRNTIHTHVHTFTHAHRPNIPKVHATISLSRSHFIPPPPSPPPPPIRPSQIFLVAALLAVVRAGGPAAYSIVAPSGDHHSVGSVHEHTVKVSTHSTYNQS